MSAGFDVVHKYLRLCEEASLAESDSTMFTDSHPQVIQKVLLSPNPDAGLLLNTLQGYESVSPFDLLGDVNASRVFSGFDLEADEDSKSSANSDLLDMDQANSEVTFYDDRRMSICESSSKTQNVGCQGDDAGYLENVWMSVTSELIKQMHDIEADCRALHISMDPMKWSSDDASKWITQKCIKNNITDINLDLFHMSGVELCQMSEVGFRCRCPTRGSELFSELEVWKNAWYFNESQVVRVKAQTENVKFDANSCPATGEYSSVTPSPDSCPSVSSSAGSEGAFSVPPSPPRPSSPPLKCIKQESDVAASMTHLHHKQTIHLWQFLKELLLKPETFSHCIKWIDRARGVFKIEDSGRVAKEWGRRKNRPAMNYDKLSRSIRQYYKKGIIRKTEHSKRLVYQFCQPYL